MSEYGKLDFSQPRTIWVTGFQIFYTIIAMIPIYYYMREILVISNEAKTTLFILPIGIALLLFLMQLRLNGYFWKAEKTFKNRDILVVSSKSAFTIITTFYIFFLYIFGYWLVDTKVYGNLSYQTTEGKLMTEVLLSLVFVYFLVIMMLSIQSSQFESNIVIKRPIRRKK